jgi:hypothetical protein
MNPEMKKQMLAWLQSQGDDAAGGNSDAGADYDQICQVIETKLAPAFEMIGQELKSLRDENDGLKDIVYKLITSFSDSVNNHRMGSMRETVLPKYAGDLGTYGPMAKDLMGDDIEQKLLEALMSGDGDPDEIANGVLGPYKEKFGKYLGGAPAPGKEAEVTVTEGGSEPQGELDLEPQAESTSEGEPPKEKKPGRASDALFEQMAKVSGRKTA